ncbi:MAG TPA: type II toxin-antitoxin system death-on-curing family toxin [Thermodesulfobacteriota bacterium]|nr:type II toxin-antitoxin system death-on-curing family toxin [Thermodesulfobacteriota bacterium]
MLFLRKQEVLDIHTNLIEQFGGTHGIRDEGALESALAAAENRTFYENAGLHICAATYAYHLTQSHAFLDGNKRVAAAVAEIFIEINGARLDATDDEIVALFLGIAAGNVSRNDVENFFTERVVFNKKQP